MGETEQPLYSCLCKATTSAGEDLRRSHHWAVARRASLKVHPDRLECGDWTVPYSDVQEAVLFSIRSLLIPGYILRIRTSDQLYQFGLNWGRFWKGALPFPVVREKGRLGHSAMSIAARAVLVAALAYWIYSRCTAG